MANLNNELVEKAREANSAEEIAALAKENGVSMTEEQAKTVYEKFHPVSGEIEDDELENVAGGGCDGEKKAAYMCPVCGGVNSFVHISSITGIVSLCSLCGYRDGTDPNEYNKSRGIGPKPNRGGFDGDV